MRFAEFLQADERQIDMIYQKARVAVEIVRMYNPRLLDNISTIAELPSGAYGLYNSGENKKVLPPETERALIGWGKVGRHNLDMLPRKTIQQYYPQISNNIKTGDTIRVNVRRIMREFPDEMNRILQVASTIVHEATHEMERETTGQTSDATAYAEENKFMRWVQSNWRMLAQKYPELNSGQQPDTTVTVKH